MPGGNSPSITIFVAAQNTPEQSKIYGITSGKHSSVFGDRYVACMKDSSARKAPEKLVRSTNDRERCFMLLVHAVLAVNMNRKFGSRHEEQPYGPTWHKTLSPVTHTDRVSAGNTINGRNASSRKLQLDISAPYLTHSFVEIGILGKHSPKHDNST